jgi:predicted kinase
MQKIVTTKPVLVMLYGFPGAGKTHFAAQLAESLSAAHVHGDRIRHELFEEPKFDNDENDIVEHLSVYMAQEFLKAGVSVVFDGNASRLTQRRTLRDITRKAHAEPILIWLQIDTDSAQQRINSRDRRKNENKYARTYDQASFEAHASQMQNPSNEEYIVISGKHTYNTQRSAVIKKMYEQGVISTNAASAGVVKPGLVNLIPNPQAGRVDMTRRNIIIR